MSHTEGKLTAKGKYIKDAEDSVIAEIFGHFNGKNDAKRLVDCWNVCQGMTDELLEKLLEEGGDEPIFELGVYGDVMEQERDEALDVLRKLTEWNEKYPSSRTYSDTDIKPITKELDEINTEALSVLAKHKELLSDE